ncbi:hypothetical protein GWC77_02810 [Paraburkholderia sp. NMBU_R16]|uniref:hypothetical protein n=1 Tax=Paraburkholderia sp. NMBU_R16 TaxID=2698676 RepID=UPI0015665280|nr:hypothetical protein [Paraburkholderia sp. NMBU_R16]NRO94874.1 hypothetical protein [Paraburkholderia sp. NMBU_R16]
MGPEPDPSTGQPKPTAGSGRGRHRAPSVLDGLRDRVRGALGKSGSPSPSPAPASYEPGQTRRDSAAALEPATARYILRQLEEIEELSSRVYGGGIQILIGEQALPEREQLLAALTQDCEITISLGLGDTDVVDALLQKTIDLVRVMKRETKAEFVFDVAKRDLPRLKELWAQAGGLPYPTPPLRDGTDERGKPPTR